MNELIIQKRDGKVGLNVLRDSGSVPAVFYGPKEESSMISIDGREFLRTLKSVGESSIITLKGIGDDKEALIQDITIHPVTEDILHVDFYIIEKGKKVTVSVPFEFVGEAPAEKLGGMVVKVMYEAELEVKPGELPQNIEVNLDALTEMDSKITLADLVIPASAAFTATDADEVVASISAQKEDEPEEVVEEDATAPEEDTKEEADSE